MSAVLGLHVIAYILIRLDNLLNPAMAVGHEQVFAQGCAQAAVISRTQRLKTPELGRFEPLKR